MGPDHGHLPGPDPSRWWEGKAARPSWRARARYQTTRGRLFARQPKWGTGNRTLYRLQLEFVVRLKAMVQNTEALR